jgi:selenocysteine lyase/cysteine desulfurase
MAQRDITSHSKPPTVQSILGAYYEFEASLFQDDNESDEQPQTTMAYLNHGGFGDPYPSTLRLREYITSLCYQQPMVYHRSLVPILCSRAKTRVCEYLKCNEDGFAFIPVTAALFGVLHAIHFQPGDVIVTSDMIYHSLVDAISHLCHTKDLHWVVVPSPHGCDPANVFREFECVLREKCNVKLCVLDHISSKPTVMFPVHDICRLCRSLRIPTLIDGAHVPGSVPSRFINIEETQATFYCVTFHKWVNAPRGNSGGLWLNKKDIASMYSDFVDISALTVCGGWAEGEQEEAVELYLDASKPGYITDGLTQGIYDESTREYENIIVLPHCLDLVLKKEKELQAHATSLRSASQAALSQAWGLTSGECCTWGDVYTSGDLALPMLAIPLPTSKLLASAAFEDTELKLEKRLKLLKKYIVLTLWEEYAIEVPVFVWGNTTLGVRISFGRRVAIKDIERLGDAINEMTITAFSCG